jgi:hypothetical protein
MDPITLMLVGGAISAVTPLIAEAFASGDREKAERLRRQAMQEYNIDLPPVEAIAVQSQAAMAKGDETAKSSRAEALRMLSQRAREGYNVEDMAAINAALGDVAAQERGSREAILRKLPANSGARTAALLSNQQAAAQQANRMGLDIAAGSRRQALQGLAAQGQLAGQIESEAFNQAFQRGQAADVISRFNEQNRMNAQQLTQQRALDMANLRAGAALGESQALMGQAQRTRGAVGGTGQAIGGGVAQYGAMQAYEEDPTVKLRRRKAEDELKKYGYGSDF